MTLCLINGQPGHISPNHRGLAYGDGLFETMKVVDGHIQFLSAHLNRLWLGAQTLRLSWSEKDHDRLRQQLLKLPFQQDTVHVLKIMLLRQNEGRGYAFNSQQMTDSIIQLSKYQAPAWVHEGVRVKLADSFATVNPSLAGMKHLNRLDSVLARASLPVSEVDEVLLATETGLLVEGSMSNVFVRIENQWYTPELHQAGVAGIIRQQILTEYPRIKTKDISTDQLSNVDAAFICNSLIGIVPVKLLNERPLALPEKVTEIQRETFSKC